jgi:hypothetical protein
MNLARGLLFQFQKFLLKNPKSQIFITCKLLIYGTEIPKLFRLFLNSNAVAEPVL